MPQQMPQQVSQASCKCHRSESTGGCELGAEDGSKLGTEDTRVVGLGGGGMSVSVALTVWLRWWRSA